MHKTYCGLIICLNILLLNGCGTKGPLYIPEQRYPQKASQAAPETSAFQLSTKE